MPEITKDMVVFPAPANQRKMAKALFEKFIESYAPNVLLKGLENIPQEGAFLITSNHQSHADGPLIWYASSGIRDDIWAVAGKVIADPNVRNFYLDSYPGFIYVERRDDVNPRQVAQMIRMAFIEQKNLLSSGTPFFVFPESTRSRTGALITAQRKTIEPALKANVPIIPCGIIGSDEIFPFEASLVTMGDFHSLEDKVNKVENLSISFGNPILFSEVLPKEGNESFNHYAGKCLRIVMHEIGLLLPEEKWGHYADLIKQKF